MTSFRQQRLAAAGQKAKAQAREGRVSNPGRARLPVVEDQDPLGKVEFASPQAREYAERKNMGWRDFAKSIFAASSDNGYTKGDVVRVFKEMTLPQDEEE